MPEAEAWLRVAVHPTESEDRVRTAVLRLFPAAELQPAPGGLAGRCPDLGRLREAIREQRIPDTARGVLLRGQEGGATRFAVGKQAAAAGKLNFASREGPLGDIHVELRAADARALAAVIDELAPDTRGWTLEARGLTEKSLRAQGAEEDLLDRLDREAGDGADAPAADAGRDDDGDEGAQ